MKLAHHAKNAIRYLIFTSNWNVASNERLLYASRLYLNDAPTKLQLEPETRELPGYFM
jgi:hypothetical protein